jgi:hypothetical protein
MSDRFARTLLHPIVREQIYFQLNPCNYHVQDNCPSAADALNRYLKYAGTIIPAFCPQPGQGFIVTANFRRPRGRNAQQQLRNIIAMLMRFPPGDNVVIHAIRPPIAVQERENQRDERARRTPRPVLAPDHYASLVKIGPPQNDVFIADCSRPDYRILYPSQMSTPPGAWGSTIEGFLLSPDNRIIQIEYTQGAFEVTPEPIQQGWRSGGIHKQSRKTTAPITSYRPTDNERGL